ncbi:MAG: Holliday junction resolvase RuvX [Oscillospiraceae bacterium]|jgi:putative Holliday junction resolvase|nr:Holliday junction resolvase RuvX [Oscillospiraceae bacterium]
MAIDHGDVRTGIAVCDAAEMIASPLCVIKQTDQSGLINEVARLVSGLSIEMIVVGHPKHMNGESGDRARQVEGFASKLKKKSSLEIVLWDERVTTVLANKLLAANGRRGKKRKECVDAVVATMILGEYLKFRKGQK